MGLIYIIKFCIEKYRSNRNKVRIRSQSDSSISSDDIPDRSIFDPNTNINENNSTANKSHVQIGNHQITIHQMEQNDGKEELENGIIIHKRETNVHITGGKNQSLNTNNLPIGNTNRKNRAIDAIPQVMNIVTNHNSNYQNQDNQDLVPFNSNEVVKTGFFGGLRKRWDNWLNPVFFHSESSGETVYYDEDGNITYAEQHKMRTDFKSCGNSFSLKHDSKQQEMITPQYRNTITGNYNNSIDPSPMLSIQPSIQSNIIDSNELLINPTIAT